MTDSETWEQAKQAWRRLVGNRRPATDGDDALTVLNNIGTVRRALDQAELAAVRTARSRGKSWAEIATYLGVTRQSAWERWRDLDERPPTEPPEATEVTEATEPADAAGDLIEMRARKQRRSSTVVVPNVIGHTWTAAREQLSGCGLIALNATPDAPTTPDDPDWTVTDQSPESGALVAPGSQIRLWLRGNGGAGVREPRRPTPTPRSAKETHPQPTPQAVS